MHTKVKRYLVHALVNNEYVEGYQVWEETLTMAANGVTVLKCVEGRIPSDRALTRTEAHQLMVDRGGESHPPKLVYTHKAGE